MKNIDGSAYHLDMGQYYKYNFFFKLKTKYSVKNNLLF